jgi:hypothetical protein
VHFFADLLMHRQAQFYPESNACANKGIQNQASFLRRRAGAKLSAFIFFNPWLKNSGRSLPLRPVCELPTANSQLPDLSRGYSGSFRLRNSTTSPKRSSFSGDEAASAS